jgi:hypothetical protein
VVIPEHRNLTHIGAEPVIWVRLAVMRKVLGYDTGGWE